ncbi:hypothetical protein T11_9932 [Trichinella zimbabwensis]|uniref:Uncharacterized protein n=1 Tax=Trichinella zimbabwensis TaxID=268475 RepID=A0A0V1GLA1_9BILA|nr:hypothetical protein T11_9932 [Trichinella zimbabwensis]
MKSTISLREWEAKSNNLDDSGRDRLLRVANFDQLS